MTYVDIDFLLALVEGGDWNDQQAEVVYRHDGDQLWTGWMTIVELMLIAHTQGWDVLGVVTAAHALVDVRGNTEDVLAAASYVDERDLPPLDALQRVTGGSSAIASSDLDYDGYSDQGTPVIRVL